MVASNMIPERNIMIITENVILNDFLCELGFIDMESLKNYLLCFLDSNGFTLMSATIRIQKTKDWKKGGKILLPFTLEIDFNMKAKDEYELGMYRKIQGFSSTQELIPFETIQEEILEAIEGFKECKNKKPRLT